MSEQQFTNFEEIEIDTSAVEAWNGEQRPLIPQGDYLLTVESMKQENGPKGTYIAVVFVVAEGEHAGAKAYNNYSLSPQAIGRMKSLQVACKTSLDKIRPAEFLGQTIRAQIVHTESTGSVDANGNPRPPKTFANVQNEQPLEEVAQQATPTKQPPVTKTATKPATNGAARRA